MPLNVELNSEVPNGDVHVLPYNVDWMESAFKSRTATEALLSPERELGNLTSRDYDDAIQFLPGNHRHYPIIGFVAGFAIGAFVPRLRYPRIDRLKHISIWLGTTFTGQVVGMLSRISAHADYLNGIENPSGYKRAMENVQKNIPVQRYHKLVLARRNFPDDASTQPTSEQNSSLTEISQKRWDQIRAANNRTQSSTWDALRQQHEKVRIKPNSQDRDDDEKF